MTDIATIGGDAGRFDMTSRVRYVLAVSAIAASTARLVATFGAAATGDLGPFTAFGFTVIFPLVLFALIFRLGPTRSREGTLMRIGTACQLIFIVAAPSIALHLLLGLPVVFLLVELFETRSPILLRKSITRMLVTC